jgi:hypothetical protein
VSRVGELAALIQAEKRANQPHVNMIIAEVFTTEKRLGISIPWPLVLEIAHNVVRVMAICEAVEATIRVDRARVADIAAVPLLSLKCRIYQDRPHDPCSGTIDDGTGRPCQCWCHS